MTEINGVFLPEGFNGIGLHDSPGVYSGIMDYNQAAVHAAELKAHGVTCYKIFSEGMKVERAQAYRDAGILTAVRFWAGNELWGRPPGQWVTGKDKIQPFVDVGVQLMELHWNEFNIDCEWKSGHTPNDPRIIARTVMDAWEVGLDKAGEVPGCIPLFPSNTPGGSVDHRWCYEAIAEEIDRRGLAPTIKHIATHNRPHNNPPDTVWTDINTVTYDEWRWIRDTLTAAGVNAYYWATEHGYSLNDDQNHDYPQINLDMWTNYNWELWQRMNPSHPSPTEPELAATFYWFEAGWGHWDAWGKDALRDSNVPEMPQPSPLWRKMEAEVGHLRFERYPDVSTPSTPPPVVSEPWQIIDISGKLAQHPERVPKYRYLSTIEEVIIHHAGAGTRVKAHPKQYAKAIARYHVSRHDWPTIAYTYLVVATPDGAKILQTLPHDLIGYHSGNRDVNHHGIGIMMSGNNCKDDPTEAQIEALCWLVKWLRLPVRAHSHIVPTACPGPLGDWWLRVKEAEREGLGGDDEGNDEGGDDGGATTMHYTMTAAHVDGSPPLFIGNLEPAETELIIVGPFRPGGMTAWTTSLKSGKKPEHGPGGYEAYYSDGPGSYEFFIGGKSVGTVTARGGPVRVDFHRVG